MCIFLWSLQGMICKILSDPVDGNLPCAEAVNIYFYQSVSTALKGIRGDFSKPCLTPQKIFRRAIPAGIALSYQKIV